MPQTTDRALPQEIRGWNWGAFLLNWIWGLGNNTFIALLCLVPFVGLVMPFVLGAKGNEWAWRNGHWDDLAHFKRVQRLWAIWGAVVFVVTILFAGGMVGSFLYLFKHSEPYTLAVSRIERSAQAERELGLPIESGFPMGSINTSGDGGHAELDFSVSGSRGKGRAHVKAVKENGVWRLKDLKLSIDGREDTIDLLNAVRADLGRGHPPRPSEAQKSRLFDGRRFLLTVCCQQG